MKVSVKLKKIQRLKKLLLRDEILILLKKLKTL